MAKVQDQSAQSVVFNLEIHADAVYGECRSAIFSRAFYEENSSWIDG